jgi:hypothetical protein
LEKLLLGLLTTLFPTVHPNQQSKRIEISSTTKKDSVAMARPNKFHPKSDQKIFNKFKNPSHTMSQLYKKQKTEKSKSILNKIIGNICSKNNKNRAKKKPISI